MASNLSPWRVLRPVLLAGAATLTWLTLSTAPAMADSTDSNSLFGGVTSSVPSVAAQVASNPRPTVAAPLPAATPASAVPPAVVQAVKPAAAAVAQATRPAAAVVQAANPAPAAEQALPPKPAGLLQPLTGTLAHTADQLVSVLPVVRDVVPAWTVSTLTAPVAGAADDAATDIVETVLPPLVEAAPILEPVVVPVSDLVTGATPLPVPLPELPELPAAPVSVPGIVDVPVLPGTSTGLPGSPELPLISDVDGGPKETRAGVTPRASNVPTVANVLRSETPAGSSVGSATEVQPLAVTSTGPAADSSAATPGSPADKQQTPSPAPVPAGPSSGAGNGAAPSPSGSAAWLSAYELDLPLPGAFPITGGSEHAPSPVSFDPGSSPD